MTFCFNVAKDLQLINCHLSFLSSIRYSLSLGCRVQPPALGFRLVKEL